MPFPSMSNTPAATAPGTPAPAGTLGPGGTSPNAPSGIPNIPPNSEYIGAGYLRRGVGDEKSAYLLMSPQGKVLARVQKKDETVDLEKFVGRSVGLKGSRWFDDRVKSDYIEVSGLEEVTIRQ